MIARTVPWLILLAVVAAPAEAQPTLRYKYKAGEKSTYVTEQKMTVKHSFNGMDIETKVDQSIEMAWEVKQVDEKDNAVMEMRITRVKVKVDSFGRSSEVDSADLKDAKDPVGKVLNQGVGALLSTKLTLKKNARGEVSDIVIVIPDDVRKKMEALPDGFGVGMHDVINMTALTQGVVFPDVLSKDKPWTQLQKMQLPSGKINSEIKYTYEGQEQMGDRKLEKISLVSVIMIEPALDVKAKIGLKSSEGKGRLLFDNKAGVMRAQTTEITMQMEVEVGGMTITQNVMHNTTVRLKDGK